MSDNDSPGFMVNTKTLGFIIGFVTISGFVFTGTTFINNYGFRLDKAEQENKVMAVEIAKISDKLDNLNSQLVSLTISLNRFEDRLNSKLDKK